MNGSVLAYLSLKCCHCLKSTLLTKSNLVDCTIGYIGESLEWMCGIGLLLPNPKSTCPPDALELAVQCLFDARVSRFTLRVSEYRIVVAATEQAFCDARILATRHRHVHADPELFLTSAHLLLVRSLRLFAMCVCASYGFVLCLLPVAARAQGTRVCVDAVRPAFPQRPYVVDFVGALEQAAAPPTPPLAASRHLFFLSLGP